MLSARCFRPSRTDPSHAVPLCVAPPGLEPGVHLYNRIKRQRAFSRRLAEIEAKDAQQHGGVLENPPAWLRVRNGALVALLFPGVFSILIWAVYVFGGRIQRDGAGVRTDMLVLSVAYPLGSLLMGAIVGLGRPVMRNLITSTLVGSLAIAPLIAGIVLSMDNALTQWRLSDTAMAAGMSLVFGAALGYGATTRTRRRAAGRTGATGR
jgi:hypothetical protein